MPIAPVLLMLFRFRLALPVRRKVSKPVPPCTVARVAPDAADRLLTSLAVSTMVSLPMPAKKRSTPPPPVKVSAPVEPMMASAALVPVTVPLPVTAVVTHCVPPSSTL